MLERRSFGARLADHQTMQFFLADSAIELYASRLMVLHAAWKIDQGLDTRQEISMLKTFVSEAFGRILDRALQVYGGAGMTHDHPIAQWYADARAARIYDGASEVHRMSIARGCCGSRSAGHSTGAAAVGRSSHETPPVRGLDPLTAFLDAHGLGEGEPVDRMPLGDGHSNPTYAVARRAPRWCCAARRARRIRSPPTTSCARRGCCARWRRPAPRPARAGGRRGRVACSARRSTSPEMVDGTVFTRATPAALDTPEQHPRIADEIVDALVEIHAVDWRAAGLEDFGRPAGYTERQVRRFAGLLEEYRTREIPALDRMTDWLQRNIRPQSRDATIVHGDYRLGNVMYAHERAGAPGRRLRLGDGHARRPARRPRLPDHDVGAGRRPRRAAQALARHDRATATRAATSSIERYAERSGRSTDDIRWYAILAIWKFCVIMEGNYRRALAARQTTRSCALRRGRAGHRRARLRAERPRRPVG